jgi:hypothetical protein
LGIRESVYLFPNLRQAVAVDAEVPLAEVAERCCPHPIGVFAETLRDSVNKGFGEIRGGGLAAEVGKSVDDDVLDRSFVGEPLDMLQGSPQDCDFSVCLFIGLLCVDEDNDSVLDLFIYVLIRYLG